jgi:TPR repeat protein
VLKKLVLTALIVFLSCHPARADFAAGKKAYDAQDWRNAILNLRPLVESGEDRSMILMGNMYLQGLGVMKDETEAFALYHRAARKGNPDGMLAIATLYQTGSGIHVNKPLALEWYARSARIGHQTGAFLYAVQLYQGTKGNTFDLKPDHAAAYKWFRIAARGNVNTPLRRAAEALANNLGRKIPLEDRNKIDQEVIGWKPEIAADLGPLPEEKAKNMQVIEVPKAEPVKP